MKVKIKDFGLEPEIKNNGLEIDVSDTKNKHLGDLYLTRAGLIWCKGKTTKGRGRKIEWKDFIEQMQKSN
jgi:hypothetical protein